MNRKFRKTALMMSTMALLGLGYSSNAYAAGDVQNVQQATKKITGTVVDAMGPVIGASILEKGTTNGTVTDFDGNFSLNVKPGATIVVSFIGFETQEIKVGDQSNFNITLKDDNAVLEEVVVIGYGVQKKKLVTGATVQVKGDDIAKLNTTNALAAMQSQTPGVSIVQSSGQAGSGFKVNIRGIGTIGDSAPLYVIDGVAGGDINSLNPSDIESIDVLKDAASAAIYGARAANGVILVTTKQGKAGKMQISYDGYVGWQYLAKKPDVLNAKEFMYAQDLIAFNDGLDFKKWENMIPAETYQKIMNGSWEGTNWLDESYHKGAMVQNHAIGLNGGNDMSKFSLGFAYTKQKGIFGGRNQSEYERYNARLNSDHVLLKVNDLEAIKIGENMTFSHTSNGGIDTGSMYWNNMHDLLVGNPLIPAYDANGNYMTNAEQQAAGYNLGTNPPNPLANADTKGLGLHASKGWNLFMSAYLQIQPIKDLIFKSQFAYRYWSGSYRSMTRIHAIGTDVATQDAASQSLNIGSSISWENTLAYTKQLGDHNINVVIGNTIQKNTYGENLNGSGKNNLFESDWDRAWVGNTQPTQFADVYNAENWVKSQYQGDWSLASFFGRASYNYAEKYMAQFTLRADGSSNFAPGKRWGYFPSASIGWVITNEKFMEKTASWLDFLKLRASWGQNGNQSISNFQYLTTFAFSSASGYYYGKGAHTTPTTGGYADVLQNPDVTWETSEQIDLGIDARFFGGRLGLAFDWYSKKTKDWLLRAPILSVYGLNAPYVNGGDVENKGIEIGLNWNDHIGNDFTYGVNFNLAYNKNEVTKINNGEGIIHGPGSVLIQGSDEVFRAQVGEPIGFFYGYKTDGVYTSLEDIQTSPKAEKYPANGVFSKNTTVWVGDVKYKDINGDGIIDENDRTNIGSPLPKFTFGWTNTFRYKNFDLSIFINGSYGNKVFNYMKMKLTHMNSTWTNQLVDVLDCTTLAPIDPNKDYSAGVDRGDGQLVWNWYDDITNVRIDKEGKLPRASIMDPNDNDRISDRYIEDGSYIRLKNVTLGYTFPKHLVGKLGLETLRLQVNIQNLLTITGYKGYDPEIGASTASNHVMGLDNGRYPSPTTYSFGVNVTF